MMMNLAAFTAGVDRPQGTPEETLHLYSYLMLFIEGATLAHYTGDRDAKRAEVAAGLAAFDPEFLRPSIARRRALIAEVDAGSGDEADLPRDVLTTLLRNEDDLQPPPDVVLRETCFFLLAGAHTSATAFVRTLHNVFAHGRRAARGLRAGLRRPGVPAALRARDDPPATVEPRRHALGARGHRSAGRACTSPQAARLTIDLMAANRDPEAFGANADEFDPHRELLPAWRRGD